MTPQLTVNLLRVLFLTFCGAVGSLVSAEAQDNAVPGLLIGLVFGLILVLVDRLLKGLSLRAFSSATLGLLLGLFFANLLLASQVLRYQSDETQWIVRLVVYCAFGYLGTMLAMRSNRDEFSLIIPYVRFARETTQHEPLVIDTNIIIDGRIADLCATGFLSRSLIVPRFVLGELQQLADSNDGIKRERGRRGLDILNQLQRSREINLTIHDSGLERGRSADRCPARPRGAGPPGAAADERSGAGPGGAVAASACAQSERPIPRPAAGGGAGRRTGIEPRQRRPRSASGRRLSAGWDDDRGQSRSTSYRASCDCGRLERAANRRRSSHLCGVEGKRACSNRAPGASDARLTKTDRAAHSRHHFIRDQHSRAPLLSPALRRCNRTGRESHSAVAAWARKTPRVARKVAS